MRKLLACALAISCSSQSPSPPPAPPPQVKTVPRPRPAPKPFLNGEAIKGDTAPPPFTGGTLIAAKKGSLVFAANPDLGRVDVVDVAARKVIWSVDVGSDSEPGRIVEDDSGKVHVVLRREGRVASLDLTQKTMTKRSACPAPRGITATPTSLWVACASGELVELPLDGTSARHHYIERDLRDVVITPDNKMYVTRFRSAELIELASVSAPVGGGLPGSRLRPARTTLNQSEPFEPHVAWRTIVGPNGAIYELHQYASTRTLTAISDPEEPERKVIVYYGHEIDLGDGSFTPTPPLGPIALTSQSIVTSALTRWVNGKPSAPILVSTAIDFAVSPTGEVAFTAARLNDGGPGVVVFAPGSTTPKRIIPTTGSPMGLAYTADGHLVMQMRDPSELDVDSNAVRIAITGSVHDTGSSIFHTPTAAGIACMSCHPEGGDDGHTWMFSADGDGVAGPRRTQTIRGGVAATAPFHWTGDMKDFSALAHDVFTTRMGGDSLSEPQIALLSRYLDWIPSDAPPSILDPQAVGRGKVAFGKAGCDSCHRGTHFTDNQNHVVGTGGEFQTPSLISVGSRAPFMHSGCANTLMDRLTNESCGGTAHGNPKALNNGELLDLATYLESL